MRVKVVIGTLCSCAVVFSYWLGGINAVARGPHINQAYFLVPSAPMLYVPDGRAVYPMGDEPAAIVWGNGWTIRGLNIDSATKTVSGNCPKK
jgi:hypothetical protein